MRTKNKIDEWLQSTNVKKHLTKFTFKKVEGYYVIRYDSLLLFDLYLVIGCFVMGGDPYYDHDFTEETIDKVKEIYSLPPWERKIIVELFEYLCHECPRKKIKKIIKEEQ